jgi:hypothetical protein
MAEKNLTIRLKTIDKELKESLKKIGQLEKTVDRLNSKQVKLKTNRAQEAAKRLQRELKKANEITEKLFSFKRTDGFGRSIAKVRDELSAVRLAFDKANSAAERQEKATALIAGNFKKIRMEATAFAQASGNREALRGAAGGDVKARLKEISEFPKTMLAGREAMGLLNRMLELSVVGSKDFLLISKAIGEQLRSNAEIQKASDKAAGLDKPKKKVKEKKEEKRGERQINEELQKRLQMEMDLNKVRQRRIRQQKTELKNEQRARSKRRQSQLLGAGFPLLFGGGAGAIGGSLAGSFLAPEGEEFGGQIFGSAIGTLLERNLRTIREIGNATQNLDLAALENSSIRVNAELDRTIKNLQRIGESEKARELLSKEIAKQTGTVEGTSENIADNINLLVDEFKQFTALASTALGIIGVPFVAALTLLLDTVNMILEGFNLITSAIGLAISELIRLIRFLPGGKAILDSIDKKVKSVNEGGVKLSKSAKDIMASLADQKQNLMERLTLGDQEAAIQKKIRDLLAQNPELKKKEVEQAVRGIAAVEKQLEQQQKLHDLYKAIGQSIETGIVDAIQGAIEGTKTLGEVARSVFSQISRSLIQFGVNSLLGSIFPGSRFFARAEGGPVSKGKNYLVGERGPEMFTPGSSGHITPNHQLGSSTNVVVNVDASGSSVQGDEQRGRELGRLISVAVQSELIQQKRPGGILS